MATQANVAGRTLSVGRITLDLQRTRLLLDGMPVELRPQSFAVLRLLVERRDELVSRQELLTEVWRDKIVTDDSLVQCLVDIRRALSDHKRQMVLTLPGRGYLLQSEFVSDSVPPVRRSRKLLRHAHVGAGLSVVVLTVILAIQFWDKPLPASGIQAQASIAVLPFADMTEAQDKKFLAEGIAEEILNKLGSSSDLRVIARTSSFAFDGNVTDLATIANKLAVSHVLEGSVRQGNDRLRITVQLIDAADSRRLWSQTYDRPMGDILAVETDVARSVAGALKVSLSPGDDTNPGADPYAHALIIQARSQLALMDNDGNVRAQRLLRQALDIEPDNVAALVALARAVFQGRRAAGSESFQTAWNDSIELTNRALSLDPDHAVAVAQRGWAELHYYQDYPAAARSFERALELDANNSEVMRLASNAMLVFDRPDAGVKLGRFAIERDPLCVLCHIFLSLSATVAGDIDAAEDAARRILTFRPDYDPAHERLGDVLLTKGEPAAALAAFEARVTEHAGLLMSKAVAHYRLGQMQEFDELRQRLIQRYGDIRPSSVAQVEAVAGNIDAAFAWLDRHLAQPKSIRGVNYHSPFYNNLHDDPRWNRYRRQFGISPEQLAQINFQPTIPF